MTGRGAAAILPGTPDADRRTSCQGRGPLAGHSRQPRADGTQGILAYFGGLGDGCVLEPSPRRRRSGSEPPGADAGARPLAQAWQGRDPADAQRRPRQSMGRRRLSVLPEDEGGCAGRRGRSAPGGGGVAGRGVLFLCHLIGRVRDDARADERWSRSIRAPYRECAAPWSVPGSYRLFFFGCQSGDLSSPG